MKREILKKSLCLSLVVIIVFSSSACEKNKPEEKVIESKTKDKSSISIEEFVLKAKEIDYIDLKDKCHSIVKGKLVKITEVRFDNSVIKEEDSEMVSHLDLSTIPYLSLILDVEKSTGQNLLKDSIELIIPKGQLTDRFLSVGEDYIFSITKSVWKIDKNHLYSRVNALRIDKKRKVLINDDGKTKPLSYEKVIFN